LRFRTFLKVQAKRLYAGKRDGRLTTLVGYNTICTLVGYN